MFDWSKICLCAGCAKTLRNNPPTIMSTLSPDQVSLVNCHQCRHRKLPALSCVAIIEQRRSRRVRNHYIKLYVLMWAFVGLGVQEALLQDMSRQVFSPRSGSFHHNVSLLLTTQCTTQPTPIRIQLSYVVATVVFRIDDMYTYIRVYASIQILYLSRYLEVLVPRAATSATALITEGMANSNDDDDDDDDNNSNSNINRTTEAATPANIR